MKIGFYEEFSASCVKRAIHSSYGQLASLGHELVKISELPYYDEIFEITLRLYFNINLMANKNFISKVEEHNPAFRYLLD